MVFERMCFSALVGVAFDALVWLGWLGALGVYLKEVLLGHFWFSFGVTVPPLVWSGWFLPPWFPLLRGPRIGCSRFWGSSANFNKL